MLGFGVSSKSVIYDRLYTNIRPIREYIKRIKDKEAVLDFSTRMTKRQEMHRVVIRGLKVGNVDKTEFSRRFGVTLETVFEEEVRNLVAGGFLHEDAETISLTRKGQLFSNNVWETFYTDDDLRPPKTGEVQFGISELVLQ